MQFKKEKAEEFDKAVKTIETISRLLKVNLGIQTKLNNELYNPIGGRILPSVIVEIAETS